MDTRAHITKLLLTDCDGTLTNVAGGDLVFTEHYIEVVATNELALELKHNQQSIAALQQAISGLNAETNRLSENLMRLQEAQLERHPLEQSGNYTMPDSLDSSGEHSISNSSDSIDKHDDSPECSQLRDKIAVLNKNKYQLEAALKKNHQSLYSLMGSKQLDPTEIKQKSLEILGKMRTHPHADFNLANGAKEFLENLLNDNSTHIHIISKNHEEYIRAMLLFNGFSEAQVDKMGIHDIRKGASHKENKAMEISSGYTKQCAATVCDDNIGDCRAMAHGAGRSGIAAKDYQKNPGEFNFAHIENKMLRPVQESPAESAAKKELRTSQLGIMGKRTASLDALKEDSSPLSPRKLK